VLFRSALGISGVSASQFGPVEKSTFKTTVEDTTGACSTCVDIDSIDDVQNPTGRRLSAEVQEGAGVNVKFRIKTLLAAGAGDADVKNAFTGLKDVLTKSLESGAFVEQLQTTAKSLGATALASASASSSGLTSNGYVRSAVTAQPAIVNSKGKKEKLKDSKAPKVVTSKAPKAVKTKIPKTGKTKTQKAGKDGQKAGKDGGGAKKSGKV